MKLILTDKEIEKLVYNAFVDGGLNEFGFSDIELLFDKAEYNAAREVLKANGQQELCCEDVLMQLFRDGKLVFHDHNEDKRIDFTPAFVKANLTELLLEKQDDEAIELVMESLKEDGNADAWTHYNILQLSIFKELVYG